MSASVSSGNCQQTVLVLSPMDRLHDNNSSENNNNITRPAANAGKPSTFENSCLNSTRVTEDNTSSSLKISAQNHHSNTSPKNTVKNSIKTRFTVSSRGNKKYFKKYTTSSNNNLLLMVIVIIVYYWCLFADVRLVDARATSVTNSASIDKLNGGKSALDSDHHQKVNSIWSSNELDVIRQRILDGLGMKSVPSKNTYNVTQDEYDAAYAEYLRAVQEEEAQQQFLAEIRDREKYGDDYVDGSDELSAYTDEEDSYEEAGLSSDEPSPTLAEYKFFSNRVTRSTRGRGRRSLPNGDKIAHFRVVVPVASQDMQIVSATASFWKKGVEESGNVKGPKTISLEFFSVDDIRKTRPKRRNSDLGLPKHKLLKKMNISVLGEEWIEVNMTDTVEAWLRNSKEDTGVLIKCPDCSSSGVTIRTGGASHVPMLHVQTRLMATKRVKRSRDMRRATRAKWRKLGDCKDAPLNGRHSSKCCKRSMTVRFDDLPNFDFVVAPKEFDAYYCSGKCPPRYNPANEHALLQSLLNMKKTENVPKPCCAPTDLKGLHFLHYGETGKLQTSFWSDVIVTECGCT